MHANTTLVDASGVGAKRWNFLIITSNTQNAIAGVATDYYEKASAAGATLRHDVYSWYLPTNGALPYLQAITSTLDEGGANPQTTKTTQVIDGNGNVAQQQIFDYNSLTTPVRTYAYKYAGFFGSGYLYNRVLTAIVTDNANHTTTLVSNTYDSGTLAAVNPLPPQFDAVQGATTNTNRGNVTQSVAMGVATNYTYDQTGSPLTGTNASGTGTSATYTSSTSNAAPMTTAPIAGTADVQNSHTVTQASSSQLTTNFSYNTALSLTSTVMPNSATASQNFNSSTGLLTSSVSVHGATTNYTYAFAPTTVTATTNSHWSKSYRDGFGRELMNEAGYGTTVVSHTDNTYGPCACSPLGKVVSTSQPYALNGGVVTATDGSSTIAWTSYVYDGRGRTITQTAPDNSVTSYVYSGNTTKITDPAGNWKRYTNDALGHLIKVEEPNPAYGQADNVGTNFVTNYTYDVEDHLIQVSMPRPYGGSSYTQTRTFNYDLPTGRLTSAVNPENGTVSYAYYSSGHLLSKTDAKGQKLVYSYDGYGRLAYIDPYPDGVNWDYCHSVALTYDSNTSGAALMGRLAGATTGIASACNSTMSEYYSYTAGGLVTTKGYSINFPTTYACGGSCEYFAYGYGPSTTFSYDTEGHQTGYSGFAYTLDAMGRPTGLTETGPGTVWVQNVLYGPGGEMKSIQYRTSSGAYYTENRTFNNRAQATEIQASGTGLPGMDLRYSFNAGTNNGQAYQMTDVLTGEVVSYQYDSLKRLIQAQTVASGGWGQSFGYDGWGNLLSKAATAGHTATAMSLSVDPSTNRATTSGFVYDANGNTTSLPAGPSGIPYDIMNRTGGSWYDQQNQPLDRTGVWNFYGLHGERLGTYTYTTTDQWYQQGSILLDLRSATQTQVTRNIYFAGRLIQSNGSTVLTDRVGSVRMTEAGTASKYYPYGEEVNSPTSNGREKFGTYTRESSSGLDYANQRYYASVYGRFLSPDPYMASAQSERSGSWNRYLYAEGDSVQANDPSGQFLCTSDDGGCDYESGLIVNCPESGVLKPLLPFGLPDSACPGLGIAVPFGAAYFAGQGGGQGGGGNSSHPAPPIPRCDISLDSQSAIRAGFPYLHTLIEVSTSTGTNVVTQDYEAGPTLGFLAPKPDPPGESFYPGPISLLFETGFSANECTEANAVARLASSFPTHLYPYFVPYNSNAFAYSVLTYANVAIPSSVNNYLNTVIGFVVVGNTQIGLQRAPSWGFLIPGWDNP